LYTQMLVPLDGSETAETALPYARALAGNLIIPVKLLGVIDISHYVSGDRARYLGTLIDAALLRNQEYLKGVAKTFPGASVEWTVEGGAPAEVIIAKAAGNQGTLLVMATHGRSGLNRFLLGSIAEKVLRGTASPLLLVRATPGAQSAGVATLKSIIVPLDGSKLAESALPVAVAVAKKLDLEVVLFRAHHVPYNPTANFGEVIARVRDETDKYLENAAAEVKKLGVSKVRYLTREGIASDEIIALARETAHTLIVMCSHGRTGMERWVLGSVTETVARHADAPVLVVRAE